MVGLPPELDVSSVNDGTEEKKLYQKQEVKISHEDLQYILNLQCSSLCKITSLIPVIHNLLREYK